MTKIRITKEFTFEMAHALKDYDGPCKNIHGHSYSLKVTLIGEPLEKEGHPKNGMVMDYNILKQIVKSEIIDCFDHALVLNKNLPEKQITLLKEMFTNIILLPYQPSCENMLKDFAERIINRLPTEVKLYSLLLRETNTSYAEWYAADNQ